MYFENIIIPSPCPPQLPLLLQSFNITTTSEPSHHLNGSDMGLISGAIKDAILTSIFVFTMPFLGVSSSIAASYLNLQPKSLPALFLTINIASIFMLTFTFISTLMSGASFNPTTTVALYTAGLKPDATLFSMALRFPAQAVGGIVGAKTILILMPDPYKQFLKGPYLKTDLHIGAIAEGVMSFVLCLVLLLVFVKGPKNLFVKVWILAVATIGLVIGGGEFTGPSLNPANAYGWAYVNNWHNTWELFYVYWICPFVGGILAAWVFGFFFHKSPSVKEKKA